MTQPTITPGEAQAEAEKAAAEQAAAEQAAAEQAAAEKAASGRRRAPDADQEQAAAAAVSMLDVVEYDHHDPILGGKRRELGVVVGVDEQGVDIVPLAGHRVRAKADEVTRLTVDVD